MPANPLVIFQRWFQHAQRAGVPLPEAMALATADAAGRPAVRFVLLKQADRDGFVFFTHSTSRKGQELSVNPRAAGVFYWDAIGRQVRFEGAVEPVSAAEADQYWSTRPRVSQLAAWASDQDAWLPSRAVLLRHWKAMQKKFHGRAVPRPKGWKGYRVVPDVIEFWTRRAARLHHREQFTLAARGWKRQLLQP